MSLASDEALPTIPGAQRLLVRQITWEATDVVSIVLVRPDGKDLEPWTLGAHIDLILPNGLIRQYSLCSSPVEHGQWKIVVLREPQSSGGSSYIHDVLRPGTVLEAVGPRNNFPLVPAKRYLLIAGGIGVTPLLPMTFALEGLGAEWHLLYGGRRLASMAFLGDLAQLGERVTVRPEDHFGLLDLAGTIGGEPADTVVYCCGPEAMIAAVEACCASTGHGAPYIERFSARPAHAAELAGSGAVDREFTLVLAKSGQRFTIPVDKTIIQVLTENHVFVATSCTEGYCGVCETEVIAGTPDHRDDYLSPERRETNETMMVCCGRSKTPELTLQL